jgi:probable HAF family extracellular repeat protein
LTRRSFPVPLPHGSVRVGPILLLLSTAVLSVLGLLADAGAAASQDSEQAPQAALSTAYTDLRAPNGSNWSEAVAINCAGQVAGTYKTGTGLKRAYLYTASGFAALRTLGGSTSYATGLNNQGLVVGDSLTSRLKNSWQGFIGTPAQVLAIPLLANGRYNHVVAVNSSGEVAGYGDSGAEEHPFLWQAGMERPVDLGNYQAEMTRPVAINDAGQIVAWAAGPGGSKHVVLRRATHGWEDLGQLGGGDTVPTAMNLHGAEGKNDYPEICGYATDPVSKQIHAFHWSADGGFQDLHNSITRFRKYSYAMGINARGEVAIYGDTANGLHVILWNRNGTFRDLGVTGGSIAAPDGRLALAINATGQTAGTLTVGADHHSFLTAAPRTTDKSVLRLAESYRLIDLGALPDGSDSGAEAVNSSGTVVGSSTISGAARAFLWTDSNKNGYSDAGEMQELSGLKSSMGGTTSIAHDVNSHGVVVGEAATVGAGEVRAFVWERNEAGVVKVQNLGLFSGGTGRSQAYGVNDSRWVAGTSTFADGSTQAFRVDSNVQFPAAREHQLGTLGGRNSSGSGGIDEDWAVAGWAEQGAPHSNVEHGAHWRFSGTVDDGTPGSDKSHANSIFFDPLTGVRHLVGQWNGRAYHWQLGQAGNIDLGTLGAGRSDALGVTRIDGLTLIAGWSGSFRSLQRAFVAELGGPMRQVGTLGGASSTAGRLNRSGWFAGAADTLAGVRRAVLGRPCTAPLAVNDSNSRYAVRQDDARGLTIPKEFGLLRNDIDLDDDRARSVLSVVTVPFSQPRHGTVTLKPDGGFKYVQTEAGYYGTDTFQYQARDQYGRSNAATVTITITPVT